jgi:hypothetical protein
MGSDLIKDIPIIGPIVAGQQASDAATTAQNDQGAVLGQSNTYSNELASNNYINPILQAGQSGINTFQSTAGGVPNIQALVKLLFGQNIQDAQQVAAQNRSSNLEGAIRGLQESGQQYNQIGGQAGSAASADNAAAQQQIFGAISGIPTGGTSGTSTSPVSSPSDPIFAMNTNTATGVGSGGQATTDPLAGWLGYQG